MISKTLAAEDWAYKSYNAYVATIILRLDDTDVTVINIYNLTGNRNGN